MSPFIKDGDVLEIKPVEVSEIKLGDVIFYRTESRIVAHRVIKKVSGNGKAFLITKGDSSPSSDEPVHPEDLLGKVITVERNGSSLRLDTLPARWINLLWVKISPFSRYIYPVLKKIKHVIVKRKK
jgi:signal peptidase I